MTNLISMEKISLRNNPNIKESNIQKFIFDNPQVLGLGDLKSIQREKIQSSGGILDLLLVDEDDNMRYEVEIQLGSTDPSHIIRTIEYWDIERKLYRNYNHCAVIIAEDITNRFFNVISLFNGAIPIIAIQLSAYKNGEDISLAFTKVIDNRATFEKEDDENQEITDRKYWEKNSTHKILKCVDEIFNNIKEFAQEFELKYNKFYIGLSKDGITKNFVSFRPKKGFLHLIIRGNEDREKMNLLKDSGLEVQFRFGKEYQIRLNNIEDYNKNKLIIDELIKLAMEYYNLL